MNRPLILADAVLWASAIIAAAARWLILLPSLACASLLVRQRACALRSSTP